MAFEGIEGNEALSLAEAPQKRRWWSTTDSWVLRLLGFAWTTYLSESERGWARLADEQARNPTLY